MFDWRDLQVEAVVLRAGFKSDGVILQREVSADACLIIYQRYANSACSARDRDRVLTGLGYRNAHRYDSCLLGHGLYVTCYLGYRRTILFDGGYHCVDVRFVLVELLTQIIVELKASRYGFLVAQLHIDAARRNIDDDDITILDLTDISSVGCLRRDMSDTQA